MGFFKKAKDVNHLVNARANKKRAVSERSPGSPRTMRSPAPLGTYAFPQSSNTVYSPTARFNGSGSPSFLQVAKSPRNTYSTCTTRSAIVQRLSFMHDMHVSGPNVPDIASTNNSRATPVIYDMDASAPNVPDIASTIDTRITPLHTSPVISYRHRTRFSDLKTRDEKMRAVHDIGKVVGGDLVGAMKFAFQNLKTVGPTLASKLNAPESLETEILELFRDIFPDKNTSLMPVTKAISLQADCNLTDKKYDLLRKHVPNLPPAKHLVEACKRTDPKIVPIYDDDGLVIAHGVDDIINDLIKVELETLLENETAEIPVPDVIWFKSGGDNYGHTMSNGKNLPNE